ncbi:HupE/UreJ family protein [Marinobacter salinexigens]|uniref:HupE/UreJ family protein n=1 Tax=Marinobacter salinexigens TaxID=2919747 RepID=A0A5B0VHM5_9GAMM|nr:HupE/UreJ family protein [Marinobacter salinexigens]KAA1174112.1 HupE/UreJ family protein [Marinobacter salinexigens]
MLKIVCKSLLAILLLIPGLSQAHDARPLYLQINALATASSGAYQYTVKMQVPPSVEANNRPYLTLPDNCTHESMGMVVRVECGQALSGQTLRIDWPKYNPSITTLISAELGSKERYQQLLRPGESSWQVPAERDSLSVVTDYSILGVEHILIGWDHLLFLLCLIWIAGTFKRLLITISGFTVAHSLTLVLTTLGYIRLPIAPVEAVIALSILFLATEIIRNRRDTLAWRFPVAVSTLFGLIHGFGFASVLQDIGLPQGDLGIALLFFNVGVEIGQVLFVGAVVAIFTVLKRVEKFPLAQAQTMMVYGAGSLAAFWTLERVSGF